MPEQRAAPLVGDISVCSLQRLLADYQEGAGTSSSESRQFLGKSDLRDLKAEKYLL